MKTEVDKRMRLLSLTVLCLATTLNGCAVFVEQDGSEEMLPSTEPQVTALGLIATDFVNSLRQVPALKAASTTIDLHVSQRTDEFTRAMQMAFERAGFGIRWVENSLSNNVFQYRRVDDVAAASVQKSTYELAVGHVEMRREYAIDQTRRVKPVSPLYVRGVNGDGIKLNDEIFDRAGTVTIAKGSVLAKPKYDQAAPMVASFAAPVEVSAVPLKPEAKLATSASRGTTRQSASALSLPADANPLNPIVSGATSAEKPSLPLLDVPRVENVFDLGVSNFSNILAEHSRVHKEILIFANDSMRLGVRNKQLVEQLVKRFNPQTDVFSVVGCSMGPTQVKGGNAALALGRAGRVVEALRFAGVDDQNILDEGCWAGGGSVKNLPARGVVLSLNRRA